MRVIIRFGLAASLFPVGCGDHPSDVPSNPPLQHSKPLVNASSPSTTKAELIEAYWNRCIEVNQQFIADNGEVWFEEFRPTAVGKSCRVAGQRLRELGHAGVDSEVIEHVNRVIRGFEQMGSIAETKGKESLWRDAASTVRFIVKMSRNSRVGVVADGGSLAIGVGGSEQGAAATSEGQVHTAGIASNLIESEEQVIRHVRNTYGVELRPW